MKKKDDSGSDLRAKYAGVLGRADRLGAALAQATNGYLSQPASVPTQIGFIQCVFGIRIWRIIKAARRLLMLRIDDPVGILARHTLELAIEVEYISTDTVRQLKGGTQALYSADKVELFTEYYLIDMDKAGYDKPLPKLLSAARARRASLRITSDWKWHGTKLFNLCEELDRAVPLRDLDLRQQNYRGFYKTLSSMFVHPNFRGTPWLDIRGGGNPTVLDKWECEQLFASVLLYGMHVFKLWNEALGNPKKRMLSGLLRDSVKLAERGHEIWLSSLGSD